MSNHRNLSRTLLLVVTALGACSDSATAPPPRSTPPGPHLAVSASAVLSVTDLGTLGGPNSVAYAINAAGQVAGYASLASGYHHAFLYTPGSGMQDLGTLGGLYSYAYGLNDAGHVVGLAQDGTGAYRVFLYTPGAGMQDLGIPSFPSYNVLQNGWDINSAGQVVGMTTFHNPNSCSLCSVLHAFVYTPALGTQDLGTLGGSESEARAINDAGQVVGYSSYASQSYDSHACLYTPGIGMQDLGTLGGPRSDAFGINDAGQVVGSSTTSSNETHAFLYPPGIGMQDLGTLGGTYSAAFGINSNGQVVGSSLTGGYPSWSRGFLYTPGSGMQDLGTLPGGVSSVARAITDDGRIAGASDGATHGTHAVVWVTTPLTQTVAIDIMPGKSPNAISLGAATPGVLAVAVLSSATFDATAIDVGSARLGKTPVAVERDGSWMMIVRDANGDGRLDLILYFKRAQLKTNGDLTSATTSMTLTALAGGSPITGSDNVVVTP